MPENCSGIRSFEPAQDDKVWAGPQRALCVVVSGGARRVCAAITKPQQRGVRIEIGDAATA